MTLTIGAITCAGFPNASAQTTNKPTVITPPAVQNGSNWSRAPFPAQRRFDDVKSPDGIAIDNTLPPNTPATNLEPPAPAPVVAVLQPAAPAVVVTTTEPVLAPTGRPTVTAVTTLDATTFAPTLRAATYSSRDQVIADLESRLAATESAVAAHTGAAADTVKSRAKALRKSIDTARQASASEWESARARLAADFDAYASAVGQLNMR